MTDTSVKTPLNGESHVLEFIDWKESKYWQENVNNKSDDYYQLREDIVKTDEIDYFHRLIRNFKGKKPNFDPAHIMKASGPMIKKCYKTMEVIFRDTLTEKYWRIEYDNLMANNPYIVTEPFKGFP